jgi:phage gp46-like protein
MAQNLQINPQSRDYVTVNGSPVPSDRVEEASYYALTIPEGKWQYGQQGQGSLLFTLANTKRNSSVEQNFAAYADASLKRQVVATGLATGAKTENLQTSRTGTLNQIEVIPSQVQSSSQFSFTSVG